MSGMNITFLGQVSTLMETPSLRFLIDPYFSNSVEENEDPSIKRMTPILCAPESLTKIDFVLLTHEHRDHCDPDTLVPLSQASPNCQFYGPVPVITALKQHGISETRLYTVREAPLNIGDLIITPVPSAHPRVRTVSNGGWMATGYIVHYGGKRYYHPGDTAVTEEVIASVAGHGGIDVGLIPVNEINFYRDRDNIIGNMSIREAFRFAEDIGVKKLIPTHWDMFEKNQVYPEEISLIYHKLTPPFELVILQPGERYAS